MVLAAGIGSRFGGIKQLASVGPAGETLLEYNLFNAVNAGFEGIVCLIREEIREDFEKMILSRLPGTMRRELAFQAMSHLVPAELGAEMAKTERGGRLKPWGTGHALLCARPYLEGGSFAVINADDFYGAEAFAAVHRYLEEEEPAGRAADRRRGGEGHFCLAAYRLGKVVSPKGSVSRALCHLGGGGLLERIVEHTHIETRDGKILSIHPDGLVEELPEDQPVSMNLWGLGPEIFPWAERLFSDFIRRSSNWDRAEFYLPSVIDSMISGKAATVRALPVGEEYFGLTNPGDIANVRRKIAGLVANGAYPSPLWKDF